MSEEENAYDIVTMYKYEYRLKMGVNPMRIAICDDESDALDMLQSLLEHNGRVSQIGKYMSAKQLQDAILDGECFDLIFMDIELSEPKNGIDLASSVNEVCSDTQIIFVTGHPDCYYQQIFLKPINLCGYLAKPVDPDVLEKLLQKAFETIQSLEAQKLLIQQNGTIHSVLISKIQYLESRGHQVTIHTADEKFICYERLEKLMERLSLSFFQCHKSYLVNMDFIRRIEKSSVLLKNGMEIPISKAKYSDTRTAFFRYMGETL